MQRGTFLISGWGKDKENNSSRLPQLAPNNETTHNQGVVLKHRVVTLVAQAEKIVVMRSLLEANCISNLSPNHTLQQIINPQNICEGVTTTTLHGYMILLWWLSHRCSIVTIYICKIMVFIACSLVHADDVPLSNMFTGYCICKTVDVRLHVWKASSQV